MKIDIDIETYLSEEEMKEIAKDVFIQKLGESMGTEEDIDRIIGNTGYRFMFNAFDKQYDCDLEKILREKNQENNRGKRHIFLPIPQKRRMGERG